MSSDKTMRTIWVSEDNKKVVQVIDQRFLPHEYVVFDIKTVDDAIEAIVDMVVRGAPLIGVVAGYAMYIAALEAGENTFDEDVKASADKLRSSRPTAVNLDWALTRQMEAMASGATNQEKIDIAFATANVMTEEDVSICKNIGENGLPIIEELSKKKSGDTVNILTHCNAGWLACVEWGTATSPIYHAFNKGIDIHVWVDETRPRNQGAGLTAWELDQKGVPHTVIVDNAGGHLMQHGLVDVVITGTDRTTYTGDVANKIGTYLKALAAFDNDIPFYIGLPSPTIDWKLRDGVKDIPIEERDPEEVKYIWGKVNGKVEKVLITPEKSAAANYGFDVTPSRLITGLITERGVCKPDEASVFELFPERKGL